MFELQSGIGNYVNSNGRRYSYFGGNNYLGLANHPAVKEAAIQAVTEFGINFSASRRTTGTAGIHIELEKRLSEFKEKEDTVTFASGYQGNSLLLDTLKDRYSVILMDQFAHPSIMSGIRGNNIKILYYKHLDSDHLGELLNLNRHSELLVITDGVFALTGEIAPLNKIYPLVKEHNAILIVDDAHSTGILGKTGKGTPEYFDLHEAANIYQADTMSKALGSYGGFISGSREFISEIREKSTTYQASTALPPPLVAAGIASLRVVQDNPHRHTELLDKALKVREQIISLNFKTTPDNTPIIPLIMSSLDDAKNLSAFLENLGIIVPFINYPVNQEINMLRITVTADHTNDQTGQLLEMLKKWKQNENK